MSLLPSDYHILEVSLFNESDLALLDTDDFKKRYDVLIANAHDIRLHSRLTGHDWIIISDYSCRHCQIQHRHSSIYPFHHQRGRHKSLSDALHYIRNHDTWFHNRQAQHRKELRNRRLKSLPMPPGGGS